MNPKFKDFVEKNPDKTMLGLWWAFNWRIMLFVLGIEMLVLVAFILLAFVFASR